MSNIFNRVQPVVRRLDRHINDLNVNIIAKVVVDTPHGGRMDWSPADKIAFSHFDNGVNLGEIWMMNPDGTSKVNLTGALGGITHISNDQPGWHPDGIHLVFQSVDQALYNQLPGTPTDKAPQVQGGAGVCNNLWLLNTQTLELTQLNQLTAPSEATLHANFSPDGTKLWWAERIANRSAQGNLTGGAKWFLLLADFDIVSKTLSNRQLFQPFGTSVFYETHGWSHDGQTILFSMSANPTEALAPQDGTSYALDIGKFFLNNHQAIEVTHDTNVWNEHAHFTKSAHSLIWISSKGYAFAPAANWQTTLMTDLWIANADGSAPRQLTFYNTPGSADYIAGARVILSDNCINPTGDKGAFMLVRFQGATVTNQVVVFTLNKVQ